MTKNREVEPGRRRCVLLIFVFLKILLLPFAPYMSRNVIFVCQLLHIRAYSGNQRAKQLTTQVTYQTISQPTTQSTGQTIKHTIKQYKFTKNSWSYYATSLAMITYRYLLNYSWQLEISMISVYVVHMCSIEAYIINPRFDEDLDSIATLSYLNIKLRAGTYLSCPFHLIITSHTHSGSAPRLIRTRDKPYIISGAVLISTMKASCRSYRQEKQFAPGYGRTLWCGRLYTSLYHGSHPRGTPGCRIYGVLSPLYLFVLGLTTTDPPLAFDLRFALVSLNHARNIPLKGFQWLSRGVIK